MIAAIGQSSSSPAAPMQTQASPPPLDQHIVVDGHRFHIKTSGVSRDLPAVVLESGNGAPLEGWDLIARELAPRTRVFSYERAGIGSSEGSGADCAAVAARLSHLLDAARIEQPVILAGHSIGGLYARYFASTRPQAVIGLVLVDATAETMRVPQSLLRLATGLVWVIHASVRLGLIRPPRSKGDEAVQGMATAQLKALSRPSHLRATRAETRLMPQTQQLVAAIGPAKNLPVLCISAGKRPRLMKSAAVQMQSSHQQLAAAGLPPWSSYHEIPDATHNGLLINPEHARTVAGLILDFAGHVSQNAPRTAG
jgi:pimeloyl-ACP methyl ester carboxylesterase